MVTEFNGEKKPIRHEVVDWVYDAALHPQNYSNILKTWDKYICNGALLEQKSSNEGIAEAKILSQHFVRAMEVFERTKKAQRQRLQSFLDEQVFASAIVCLNGKVLASNEIAKIRLPLKPTDSLFDLSLEATSLEKFRAALLDIQKQPEAKPQHSLSLRILDESGTGTLLIAEVLPHHGFTDCDEEVVILIKSCLAEWNEAGAGIIQEAFDFTLTEMEVLEHICFGKTAKQIAELSGRKLQTVRWHIKNLLAKAQLNSQSELVRIVTGVLHVSEKSPLTSTRFYVNWKKENTFQRLEKITLKDGRVIQFARYGHKVGTPILSLHDYTSLPISPKYLVQAIADAGLQIISPYKVGFGENTSKPNRYDPKLHINDCIEILDHLEIDSLPVCGFGAGGVNALLGASLFPRRFRKVGLINVGAPLTTQAQYEAMSQNARIIFWTAHLSPELLYAPQTFTAESYFAAKVNKKKYIKLIFANSPIDAKLIADPRIYKLFKDCINLALSDPIYQVDEHAFLFSDWKPIFDEAIKTTPVHFIQGADHDFMIASELEKFRALNSGTTCTMIQNTSRLIAYGQPKLFAQAMKELVIA